jgi:hypothetical protein
MTFTRVLLAWALLLGLFAGWRELERILRKSPEATGPTLRQALPALAVEAGLLTLFAGLWFASLGSGGGVLLFLLVGALMEIPPRLRHHGVGELHWKPVVGGIVRIELAGLLLGLVMG